MKRYLITLSLFFIYCSAFASAKHTIWQLGNIDDSSNEFALSPDGKDRFITSGFGNPRYYFFAVDDNAALFPYILPGPTAQWAGSSYWAGQCMIKLPIVIRLNEIREKTNYELNIQLTSLEYEDNMFLRAKVNGVQTDRALTELTKNITFSIPAEVLCEGINIITLQLFNGKSVTFDALSLCGSTTTIASKVGEQPVVWLSMADYEISTKNGDHTQPVILKTISRKTTNLNIHIGENIITKIISSGENTLEIPTIGTKPDEKIKVSVLADGKQVANGNFRRTQHKLRRSIDYVNQFAGSSGSRWMIGPGPWMPFGMVKIMPDNEDEGWKAGYEYNVENIMGFSHIHEWTMTGLLTMPTTGKLQLQPGSERDPDAGYRSRIDKKSEVARIGYYGVNLTDYNIHAELTATTRASMQRYTFKDPDCSRILVDFFFPAEYTWTLQDVYVKKISDTHIEGWTLNDCQSTGYHGVQNYRLHFVMQFDKPFTAMNGWIGGIVRTKVNELSRSSFSAGNNDAGDAGLWLDFALSKGESVSVRTGISLVSTENALLNLTEEIIKPFGWDFAAVEQGQRSVWNNLFERVKITTDDYSQKEKFYTNLYRAISPRTTWNDINGQWRDMNGNIAQIEKKGVDTYGGDSAWGMHWTLGPFYNLLYPEYMSNWIYTYEQFYLKGGWLPVGNPGMRYFRVMIGNPALPLIVSGYQHGIRDFNTKLMADAILHQQTAPMQNYPGGGQVGNESYPDYITKGYVPLYDNYWDYNAPHGHSYVSNTMEYAYQDYCAAQYFKATGNQLEYKRFTERSHNWENIFDPSTGYIRPRKSNGEWIENTDPSRAPGFCEGSAWQFTWYVPHEPEKLRDTIGERLFIDRLNAGFETSEKVSFNALGDNMSAYPINHGNETNMQAAYLFNFTSEPWHTQRWTRAIQQKYYGQGPRDAYPGDEDQGQMSSWYVMSCLGLFQMDGGCGIDPLWTLGSPRFERAEIKLDNKYHSGKMLVIEAHNSSEENCYIKSVSFNGQRLREPFIAWSKLREGGVLSFVMDTKPCKEAFDRGK